jgi:uracil-DNA glycosylase
MSHPWNLDWFQSGECQVIREHLDDMEKYGIAYHPPRKQLFKALSAIKPENVKVLVLGQDPYPNAVHATGLAFSVPSVNSLPPTLKIMFDELVRCYPDIPYPTSGNLQKWVDEGCLLWNVCPVFSKNYPALGWVEWKELTRSILKRLEDNNLVIAALGTAAKSHLLPEDYETFRIITVGHPSPRGNMASKSPFTGSELFKKINVELVSLGQEPIDWRL